ncbi:hypothetical protein EVAR_17931_1 [Eumeta japonica]|uniref:FLYWCH-type domain-containing protein n=1 Tax=Eumeta variegata TaxID=151549 RepID=A0A4C1UZR5_EUMVA|nr:hypothetical protein EVAR_17931_1 [Eumeta japonica]
MIDYHAVITSHGQWVLFASIFRHPTASSGFFHSIQHPTSKLKYCETVYVKRAHLPTVVEGQAGDTDGQVPLQQVFEQQRDQGALVLHQEKLTRLQGGDHDGRQRHRENFNISCHDLEHRCYRKEAIGTIKIYAIPAPESDGFALRELLTGPMFVQSRYGKPAIQIGKYRFNKWSGSSGARARWICVKVKAGCPATLVTIEDEIVKQKPHNH